MNISKGIVAADILKTMQDLQVYGDTEGFYAFSKQVKARAVELMAEERPEDAADILRIYGSFFFRYEGLDPAFTKSILPLFPPNKEATLRHLGMSKEVDDYLIHQKIDRTTFSRAKEDSVYHVLKWALIKGETRFADSFVSHVAQDLLTNHPDDVSMHIKASREILSTVAWDCRALGPVSSTIDQALASLINHGTASKLLAEYWGRMALTGLHESMLKAMKYGLIHRLKEYTPDEHAAILAALPVNPTPEQAHWITQCIPHPELEQRILFDQDFDLDAFIVAMKDRKKTPFRSALGDLTFEGVSVFKTWMEPDQLDTSQKKSRLAKLLNAVADNHFNTEGSPKTSKHVREELDKQNLPGTVRRIMKMFKGQELEDELGL